MSGTQPRAQPGVPVFHWNDGARMERLWTLPQLFQLWDELQLDQTTEVRPEDLWQGLNIGQGYVDYVVPFAYRSGPGQPAKALMVVARGPGGFFSVLRDYSRGDVHEAPPPGMGSGRFDPLVRERLAHFENMLPSTPIRFPRQKDVRELVYGRLDQLDDLMDDAAERARREMEEGDSAAEEQEEFMELAKEYFELLQAHIEHNIPVATTPPLWPAFDLEVSVAVRHSTVRSGRQPSIEATFYKDNEHWFTLEFVPPNDENYDAQYWLNGEDPVIGYFPINSYDRAYEVLYALDEPQSEEENTVGAEAYIHPLYPVVKRGEDVARLVVGRWDPALGGFQELLGEENTDKRLTLLPRREFLETLGIPLELSPEGR